MGDPDICLRMLISQVECSDVGSNCAMDFSAWKRCSRAWMPEIGLRMFAQTLPALPVRQEWPVREELAGVEGFFRASPEGVCAKESTGVGEFVGAEDWGYTRPVADGESPFCVRPVTGSHLFRSHIGRVLGLWQLHLPFRHLSGQYLVTPFLLYSVLVGHDVVRDGLACGGPSGSGCSDHGTAAGHIYRTRIRLEVGQTLCLGRCHSGRDRSTGHTA